jgi:cytochrome c-type biogenesis protein CcmH
MAVVTVLVFIALALAAAAFAVWPVLANRADKGRAVLAAAIILFVAGAGGGTYLWLGQPGLALRSLKGADDRSLNAIIGRLAKAMRQHPDDPRGWALLGQAYITAHDPDDAASAFARAIDAAAKQGRRYSFLYSAYGEALAQGAAGAVTPDAETAFKVALTLDPKDQAARYYLGLAAAANGNATQALAYWRDLLADVPANSPLHAELVDRIARLTAAGNGPAPNIQAMVEGLAARLKADPSDAEGWQRLVRAYHVLGDDAKARAALADARKAATGRQDVLAALAAEAKELGL